MYGDDSSEMDINDILDPIIEEFSIKLDVNLKNMDPPVINSKKQATKVGKKTLNKEELSSYSNLKNNYLGRISSPMMTGEEVERRSMRDEQTPEQLFERKMSSEQHAYYNVYKGEDQLTLPKGESGNVKLQDNVKTILGVKD